MDNARRRFTREARKLQPFVAGVSGDVSQIIQSGDLGGIDLETFYNNYLTHLDADSHTQYLNTTRHDTTDRHGSSVVDHGLIGGLGDDDHTQYYRVDGSRAMGGSVLPALTDTYDLGSSTLLWRKGWLSEMEAILFAENTISVIGGWFYICKDQGVLASALSNVATTYDFGKAMTPNDFVIFRAAGQVEYIKIGSLVSGTTYNITRNLDGSGANTWVAGSVYAVLGNTGNGRIELNAYDTPRISIVEQCATYNAQTERIRIGDLASWQSAGLTGYGLAVGDFAGGEYLHYTPGSCLVVRGTVDADDGYLKNLSITGILKTGASPNPRIEMTPTELAGYSDATTKQFWLSSADGKAYAGGGNVVLEGDGIRIAASANSSADINNKLRFFNPSGGAEVSYLGAAIGMGTVRTDLSVEAGGSGGYLNLSATGTNLSKAYVVDLVSSDGVEYSEIQLSKDLILIHGDIEMTGSFFGTVPVCAQAVISANFGVPNNTTTTLNAWGGTTQNRCTIGAGGITVGVDGYYLVNFAGYWQQFAGGSREVILLANGGAFAYDTRGSSPDGFVSHSVTGIVYLPANGVISVTAWQNAGGALNLDGATHAMVLTVMRIA